MEGVVALTEYAYLAQQSIGCASDQSIIAYDMENVIAFTSGSAIMWLRTQLRMEGVSETLGMFHVLIDRHT